MFDESLRDASRAAFRAALHPDASVWNDAVAKVSGRIDWQWLVERAAAHKLSALIGSRVVSTFGTTGTAPASIREEHSGRNQAEAACATLQEAQTRARLRHAQALADLAQIDACLLRAGIAYLLVKGPVLTEEVYGQADQRHFFDLDLVVDCAQVDAAEAALRQLGYHLWGVERYLRFTARSDLDRARAERTMRASLWRAGNQRALVTPEHRLLPIDLHWHLMPKGRMRAEPAELWRNTRRIKVGGVDVETLDAEATLLHLAVHAWCNRPWSFALLHVVDFAWALHRLKLDPLELADLAQRWGVYGDLLRSLHAARFVLGIAPPEALLRMAQPASVCKRFVRIATPASLIDHYPPPEIGGWAAIAQRLDWGLATQTLRSSVILSAARYTAVLRRYGASWLRTLKRWGSLRSKRGA